MTKDKLIFILNGLIKEPEFKGLSDYYYLHLQNIKNQDLLKVKIDQLGVEFWLWYSDNKYIFIDDEFKVFNKLSEHYDKINDFKEELKNLLDN